MNKAVIELLEESTGDKAKKKAPVRYQSPRVSVLAIDDETADRWAIIAAFLKKSRTLVASTDIWIAASAMQHGLPILTSDRDFQKISQVIVHHFLPV